MPTSWKINSLFVLFWIVLLTEVPRTESFDLKTRLSETDEHHVDQLNRIRAYVGSGYLAETFSETAIAFLRFAGGIVKTIGFVVGKIKQLGSIISDGLSYIGLGRRRDASNDRKPTAKPLLGPSTQMNELRWNKRLSQLVYLKMEELAHQEVQVFRNKTYRAFQHGTLFEALVNDLFPVLRVIIDDIKVIWTCFMLLTTDVDQPVIIDESKVKGEIFEYLFDYYVEVGCGTNVKGSWCLIGPVKNKDGSVKHQRIIDKGPSCVKCNTTCLETPKKYAGMCEASPDFEDQKRLREIMRQPVEIEDVVVEEITLYPETDELDSAAFYFPALYSSIILVVFLIFRE